MPFDPHHSDFIYCYSPRNRHSYISVTREGEVKVKTPLKDHHRIRKLLAEKSEWINKRLMLLEDSNPSHILGETIGFRGEIISVDRLPKLKNMIDKSKNSLNIKKYYDRFYHDEAKMTIPSRLRHYTQKMGLYPSEIRYKKMRRRWGSCDSKGVITFNVLMMQLSYRHIDYIIVHELAHLRHMNHSKEFHALVRDYLEDEVHLRRELKSIRIH